MSTGDKSRTQNGPVSGDIDQQALFFHRHPRPGKVAIAATKQLVNQRDLALAYSPGVAAACEEIVADPANAFRYTSRGNLVAVISNGTAVLGLGDIGPLASKPVMEGKGVLFKKFAGIDVFDLEIDEKHDLDKLVDVIAALEPTFGGINLEDIKAPDCFYVERELRKRMKIPVFHDDQHGTAIISAAALLNGLELVGKDIGQVKLVASGAGAAAIACLNLLLKLGLPRENIYVTDLAGVVYEGRTELMDPDKALFAQKTEARSLREVIAGADVFLGLSAGGVLKADMVASMAAKPLIFALANPTPEILPEEVKAVRADAIMATGRSDYPNQVNNVLCFPYIFRGALDCGATKITEAMKLACVREIAALAKAETSDEVAAAYAGQDLAFGPDYLIPKPFDARLILRIAPAVAQAAAESGVATRPIQDLEAYRQELSRFVYQTGMFMRPVFAAAKAKPARVIYAEGEDERVLRAVQVALDEGLARPTLIGRPEVIETRLKRYGLRVRPHVDFEVVNPDDDPRYRDYVDDYLRIVGRKGVNPEAARTIVRTNQTVIGALAVRRGEADALICGVEGRYARHLRDVSQIIGKKPGVLDFSGLSLLISQRGATFFTDTYVTIDPTAEEVAEMTVMAAAEIRRFGITPRAALVSHSNFGSRDSEGASKMRRAMDMVREIDPTLEADGEMHGDAAISEALRQRVMPDSTLSGEANLLVFPNLDAANITLGVVKTMTDSLHVGPILLGAALPAHILSPSATSRGVVNMAALAVVEASYPA
ncbi:UNVERIFIED_ORG: NADP-dependent malic enzyme [Roseateles sp. XES5]|nr:NADP-dependent malic enzyme [Roseateles sp. XES5]